MASEVFAQIGVPQADTGNNPLPGADERHVFTQPPSGPMPSQELAKINYDGLEDAGAAIQQTTTRLLTNYMNDKATEEAAGAVSRDPTTGELQVDQRPQIFAWDKTYNDVAQKLYQTQATGDINQQMFVLAQKNAGDPQAFQQQADAFRKAYIAKAEPGSRADLSLTALQLQNQFTEGLFQAKAKSDTADAKQGLENQREDLRNQIAAIARQQGGVDTPDFRALVGQYSNVTEKLVANPMFGYGKADQQKDLDALTSTAHAEAAVGMAIRTGRTEGEQAGLDALNKNIWDPSLNLTPAERASYESSGRVQIREDSAAARTARDEQERALLYKLDDAGAKAESTGKWNDFVNPNDIISAFGPDRGGQIIEGLNGKASIYAERKWVATATPTQFAAREAQLDPGKAPAGQVSYGSKGDQNLANNNPGNLRIPGQSTGFQTFPTMQAGVSAVDHQLGLYMGRGNNTIAGIVSKYAPPGVDRNNTTAYIAKVAELTGKMPNESLTQADIPALRDAMIYVEQGGRKTSDLLSGHFAAPGGSGFTQWKAKAIEYHALMQAWQERQHAIADDPAAYVVSARPDIAKQGQAALEKNDAAGFQNVVRQSLQVQRDLGVLTPRILSKADTSSIVQQFSNPPDPTKAADFMNGKIDGLAQAYGQYFPQVMRELQRSGIPPEAAALTMVRGNGGVAARMAESINAMSRMGKDLNEGRDRYFAGTPNNKQITAAIPDQIKDYTGTLIGYGADGPVQSESTRAAVNLYAHQLAYEGKGSATAASQAYHDLIGSRYNFVDTYRVPQGIDTSTVRAGANYIRQGLKATELAPQAGLPRGTPADQGPALAQRILSQRGVWVTRPDDKGLFLSWPGDAGYVPAHDNHGNQISYSWSALAAAGSNPVHRQNAQDAARESLTAGRH